MNCDNCESKLTDNTGMCYICGHNHHNPQSGVHPLKRWFLFTVLITIASLELLFTDPQTKSTHTPDPIFENTYPTTSSSQSQDNEQCDGININPN